MAAPASTQQALEMILTGLSYLAAADPAALAAQAQAECLQTLEHADAIATAARARILAAFTAGQGHAADADYSPTSWLIHRTKVTKGAARGHLGWARRAAAHPQVVAALAEGTVLTESIARLICGWTGRLPESCRDAADGILVAAARAGARKQDLAALAAEIYARSLPEDEDDPEPSFEDRQVRVETTFAGAGVIYWGPHPGGRRGGDRGAGGPVGAAGRRGHPDPGAALPRRAGRCDAPPGGLRAAAGAGRSAGESLGARVPGRAARPGRRVGPGPGVDRGDGRAVGRPPGRRLPGRQRRRRLAGRQARPRHGL